VICQRRKEGGADIRATDAARALTAIEDDKGDRLDRLARVVSGSRCLSDAGQKEECGSLGGVVCYVATVEGVSLKGV
jgi:hypothetical protein